MKLDKKMSSALNEQINKEIASSYLYLSMAAHLEAENLSGFANWMHKQASEEMEHAMKIFHYIYSRGDKVILKAIAAPQTSWESPLRLFQEVYAHEEKVTASIHNLVDIAKKLNDHATFSFLQWFVDEQVEEEASAEEVVQKLSLVKDHDPALLMLDKMLGKRGQEQSTCS